MKRVINGKTYSKTIGVKKGELAAFGDNGELNGSGVKASDIPSFPEGGNVGDVLTKTADGQEWSTPSAGGKVYLHYCYFGSFTVVFPVEKSTPFTKEEFVDYVNSLLTDSDAVYHLTGNGYYYDSTYGIEPLHLIPLRKQFGTPIFDNNYIRFDGDGVGYQVGHSFSITVSHLTNFKDSVLPIS